PGPGCGPGFWGPGLFAKVVRLVRSSETLHQIKPASRTTSPTVPPISTARSCVADRGRAGSGVMGAVGTSGGGSGAGFDPVIAVRARLVRGVSLRPVGGSGVGWNSHREPDRGSRVESGSAGAVGDSPRW